MKNRRFHIYLSPENAVETPDDYVSLTIDTSLAFGGRWWGETNGTRDGVALDMTEPLDVENRRFIRLASFLAPAMLRIGGTEADRLSYRVKKRKGKKKKAEGADSAGEGTGDKAVLEPVLKRKFWKRINSLARHAGFTILFTINAGPRSRDERGSWKDDQARKLIAYTAKKKYPVTAWELGNEVNGFLFIHGIRQRVGAAQYVRDFAVFSSLVREIHLGARAVGPASAVWPVLGEPDRIIPALGGSSAAGPDDAISWHYYPQQSSRGGFATRRASERLLLSPRRLDGILRYVRKIREAARGREIWLTETGHALYGGQPRLSDTYASTPWWLDELGLLAREGTTRVFRQTLAGSDYGLLDQDTFDPRPDFYASFLWKRLMGRKAYPAPCIDGPDRKLRVYIHDSADDPGKFCMLVINLGAASASTSLPGRIRDRYILTPAGGFTSKRVRLNGVELEEDILYGWNRKRIRRKYLIAEKPTEEEADSIMIPPFACAFIQFKV